MHRLLWNPRRAVMLGSLASRGASIITPGTTATAWGLYVPGPTWCFKDTNGTQPCAAGDTVAYWKEYQNNGRDLVQSTAGSRFTMNLRTIGGRSAYVLTGDGSKFLQYTTASPFYGAFTAGWVSMRTGVSAYQWLWHAANATAAMGLGYSAQDKLAVALQQVNHTNSATDAPAINTWNRTRFSSAAGLSGGSITFKCAQNNGAEGSGTLAGFNASATTTIYLGSNNGASQGFPGDIAGTGLYASDLSSADLALFDTWLNNLIS
jgi:hypothetical protein